MTRTEKADLLRHIAQDRILVKDGPYGTAIQGFQEYKIYPVAPDGRLANLSDEYAGEDHTMGPSGSCGRNQWPVVRMPFYMKKIAG